MKFSQELKKAQLEKRRDRGSERAAIFPKTLKHFSWQVRVSKSSPMMAEHQLVGERESCNDETKSL